MVGESTLRKTSYLMSGCNTFDKGKEKCRMLSIWTQDNVWVYAHYNNLRFAEVYYDRSVNGEFVPALDRTGCIFCLFGIHHESDGPNIVDMNRFQRLKISHPRQYKFCIDDLGIGKVLDFIGVKY